MESHDRGAAANGALSPADTALAPALEALRHDIREAAARRRAQGELPPDEDLELLQAELWVEVEESSLTSSLPVAETADFDRPMPPDVSFTLEECEVLPANYQVDWHRPVVGQAHAAVRRQINAEVRRYVDPALARQTRLNYRLTELLQRIVRDHGIALDQLRDQVSQAGGLRMELDALRAQASTLKAELLGLRSEVTTAREDTRRLAASVRLFERAATNGAAESPDLHLDYLAFNERVGGGLDHERQLYSMFLPYFAGVSDPVVDLGCGRGPFLDLLRGIDVPAIGVDRDAQVVSYSRGLGHRVIESDALTFLDGVEEGTLGGLFAAHLVEHLPRPSLAGFFKQCRRALAPGGHAVFITPDPRSLFVLSDTFFKDLTHVAPIHPAALTFLAEQADFASHEVRTLSPVPEARHLEGEDIPGAWSPALRRNMAKMEELLFGDLDYALIARR